MNTYSSLGVGIFALAVVVVTLQDSCGWCRVVTSLFSIIMTTFDLQAFVLNPGGDSAGQSLPPPRIPAGPETRTCDLWVTSPTLHPLGHDCPSLGAPLMIE